MKTTYFIALLLLVRVVYAQPKDCRIADILFVTDWSGSMRGNENFIVDAFKAILDTIDLSDHGVKIGFISFNNEATVYSHLTSNTQELYNLVDNLSSKEATNGTMAHNSLLISDSLFLRSELERGYETLKILIFISDGGLDDIDKSLDIACYLKQQGIKIIGVQILDRFGTDDFFFRNFFIPFVSDKYSYFNSSYLGLRETLLQINFCL